MSPQSLASPWWSPQVHVDRRPALLARNRIEAAMRGWLGERRFVLVDPPGLQRSPGNEAHLHAFATSAIGEDGIDSEELKKRITINGATETTEGEAGAVDSEAYVSALLEATDRNEAQLLSALGAAGYDFDDIAAFKEAISSGEFPGTPDNKLIFFLSIMDADLNTALDKISENTDPTKTEGLEEDVTERLAELLQALYPNDIVSEEGGNTYTVSINGTDYEWGIPEGGDPTLGAA